ncbi:MAG TPA: hypothetical protein VI636_16465 [Candidatus Angelobacter sp.]
MTALFCEKANVLMLFARIVVKGKVAIPGSPKGATTRPTLTSDGEQTPGLFHMPGKPAISRDDDPFSVHQFIIFNIDNHRYGLIFT